MKIFSATLGICAGNSPVPGEFPTQRPVTRSFDVFFDLRLNKRLSKQSWGWSFETLSCPLWRHCNGVGLGGGWGGGGVGGGGGGGGLGGEKGVNATLSNCTWQTYVQKLSVLFLTSLYKQRNASHFCSHRIDVNIHLCLGGILQRYFGLSCPPWVPVHKFTGPVIRWLSARLQ